MSSINTAIKRFCGDQFEICPRCGQGAFSWKILQFQNDFNAIIIMLNCMKKYFFIQDVT